MIDAAPNLPEVVAEVRDLFGRFKVLPRDQGLVAAAPPRRMVTQIIAPLISLG